MGTGIAIITSVGIMAAMLGFGRWILAWFLPADAGQGMEALDIAYRYLSIMAVFLPVLGGEPGDERDAEAVDDGL